MAYCDTTGFCGATPILPQNALSESLSAPYHARMANHRTWQGVRMRRVMAGADPDAPPRHVTIPACWHEAEAAALAALAPGQASVSIAAAAEAWIAPIAARRLRAGLDPALAERLHRLLLLRRGAPDAAIWQGGEPAEPGFVLNLAAFHDAEAGFDIAGFADAVETAVVALSLAVPAAARLRVRLADLAGLLARLGLDYRDSAARGVAACLAALLRGRAEAASAMLAERFGARASAGAWPAPPAFCAVPGLAEAARAARRPGAHLRHAARAGLFAAGPRRRVEPGDARVASGARPVARGGAGGGASRREPGAGRRCRRARRHARRGRTFHGGDARAAAACANRGA
jgi:ribonucleoside-diphosphate reductase alpha chain